MTARSKSVDSGIAEWIFRRRAAAMAIVAAAATRRSILRVGLFPWVADRSIPPAIHHEAIYVALNIPLPFLFEFLPEVVPTGCIRIAAKNQDGEPCRNCEENSGLFRTKRAAVEEPPLDLRRQFLGLAADVAIGPSRGLPQQAARRELVLLTSRAHLHHDAEDQLRFLVAAFRRSCEPSLCRGWIFGNAETIQRGKRKLELRFDATALRRSGEEGERLGGILRDARSGLILSAQLYLRRHMARIRRALEQPCSLDGILLHPTATNVVHRCQHE
jgi:hypothetical protein